jgi:L-glyceraldehyde 3-phosphate reductase
MFERWVEGGLLDVLEKEGVGCIPFSPLAQGLLTNKYLKGIPDDSRAHKATGFLKESEVTPEKIDKVRKLNELAIRRDQTLAQMALAWILRDKRITSVLVGASRPEQVSDALESFRNTWFSADELKEIEGILAGV